MRQVMRKQYGEMYEAFAKQNTNLIKPKPKYVPEALWIWAIGFFIKIKK